MLEFRLSKEIRGNRPVVEVWNGDDFIASIYPHESYIVMVSKWLNKVEVNEKCPKNVLIEFKVKK